MATVIKRNKLIQSVYSIKRRKKGGERDKRLMLEDGSSQIENPFIQIPLGFFDELVPPRRLMPSWTSLRSVDKVWLWKASDTNSFTGESLGVSASSIETNKNRVFFYFVIKQGTTARKKEKKTH